ncbi:MAG: COQ9 family protein [Rhodospirillaceae bacterium]|nr:COQ9 family protein [Rhodospirillaceae bacterium]|tara:strand:+ start:191 stop:832 length:642 start_codon:yes stop_codon:yes gene_type:complete
MEQKSMRDADNILMDRVVLAALQNIPFDGLNMNSVCIGAKAIGCSVDQINILFPNGIRSFISHWSTLADRMLGKEVNCEELMTLRVRDRIALLVQLRLSRWYSNRDAIKSIVGLSYLPPFREESVIHLSKTIDTIWCLAGDKSVDFNFYSKRLLLGGVFSSTLLFWLEDNSQDSKDSWEFLDRRISNIMCIPKIRGKVEGLISKLPKVYGARV